MKIDVKGKKMLKLYVNDDHIKDRLKNLGLGFHDKPGGIQESDTLAVVLRFLSDNGEKDYDDVNKVISNCTNKTHIPVIVLDGHYDPGHAAKVWLRKNVVRYLPLDDPRTLEEVKRFLVERMRRRTREAELTSQETLKVGWSVKIEEGSNEEASLVSLFVGSMGRFMVELKTLLNVIRPEVKRSMEDGNSLTPAQFKALNLEKVMEFKRAVNVGKEAHEFENGRHSLQEMKDYLEIDTNASRMFKSPEKRARNYIIVEGETGSGKTLIARFIHDYVYQGLDSRGCGELVKVNCANLGEKIMETQLFGSMDGAYTDARTRPGAILRAYHGTVFLDEVGELTLELQARLLNYLDTQTLYPDGWYGDPIYVPSLIVAATNRRLVKEVDNGTFRRDLHHRLGFTVTIPPLRERLGDLDRLVDFVLQNPMVNPWWDNKKKERAVEAISKKALDVLRHHPFPGNFRELEQVLRRACVTAQTQGLRVITEDVLRLQGLYGEYCP